MEEKLEEMVKGLTTEKARHWKLEEVEEYLSKQGIEIEKDMMLTLLECLADDDIWKWLFFVGHKLPHVASTEEKFLDFLVKIARKVRGDMAQGPFITGLINIGSNDPKLGFALFKEMVKKDSDLIYYASFPLGGAGKIDFDEAFKIIKEGFESSDSNLKATSIRAWRVVFEKEERELKESSEVFHILDKASDEEEDVVVRNEAANAYIDFSRFSPKECTEHLIKLARQDNPDIRFNLAMRLQTYNLPRSEDEIEILKICAQDDDERVLWRVSLALAFKGKQHPEETLEIVKNWVKRGKYLNVREIDFCLQEIGKGYLDRCIKTVETWIEKEEDLLLRFFIPNILKELCSSNYGLLIESIKTWPLGNIIFKKMTSRALREILTAIFPPKSEHQSLIDSCFSILIDMTKEGEVDVETVIRGEPEKFYQCFRLIEEFEQERPKLDFDKMYVNLEKYPKLKDFLNDGWFERKRKENNKTHPLLIILSYEQNAFLNHLEKMLEIIVSKSTKHGDLRDGLRNGDQFRQTVSEIEVISSFIRQYRVEIAPEIEGKKLDARIEIDGKDFLVEVINPEMFKPLRYLTGKTLGIGNRARGKIYDEFKKHLKDVHIEENIPIIIVIDTTRSEIDYEFVEDYLMGTLQLVMLFDKKKGEVVKTYPARAEDSMHALTEETDILSAVLCYKRCMGKDNAFHFEGRIILNQYAKNPLSQELIERIEKTMFGNLK